MGDGGFRGDYRVKVPFRRDEIRQARPPMNVEYLNYNKRFRRERVFVENDIGEMRQLLYVCDLRVFHCSYRFYSKILSECWPGSIVSVEYGRLALVWRTAALLFNWRCHTRGVWPMNDDAFDPDDVPIEWDDEIPDDPFL